MLGTNPCRQRVLAGVSQTTLRRQRKKRFDATSAEESINGLVMTQINWPGRRIATGREATQNQTEKLIVLVPVGVAIRRGSSPGHRHRIEEQGHYRGCQCV
jgi:hypothetical protein